MDQVIALGTLTSSIVELLHKRMKDEDLALRQMTRTNYTFHLAHLLGGHVDIRPQVAPIHLQSRTYISCVAQCAPLGWSLWEKWEL